MQDVDTVDKKIILLDELESNRLNIPLPQVNGYKWGWIRFALGGYTSNVTPEKDDKHLKSAVENGWMPCVKSPHPALPLNKAGYVTAGDLVLCVKRIEGGVFGCEYLATAVKEDEKMIEIIKGDLYEIYDRNEILCENGIDIDIRKAKHRAIKYDSAIGDIWVNQVRDLSGSGASWITLPGVYPGCIKATEAYEKFKEDFGLDNCLVVEKK